MTQVYKSISKVRKSYPAATATTQSGLYADNWASYINSPSWWKSTVLANGINFVTYYMASLLDNGSNRTAMRSFLSGMVDSGVTRNFINTTQSANVINLSDAGSLASYQAGCANAKQKFTGCSSEIEFWAPTNPYFDSFDEFTADNVQIYDYCKANGLEINGYIARFRDGYGVKLPTQVAEWCVSHYDTIFLVDYVSEAKFIQYSGLSTGIQAQIQLMADAAKKVGKVQKFCILWASTGNGGVNMGSWFASHPVLLDAFNIFRNAYNNWTFANKSSLSLTGQKIYNFSGLYD